MKPEMLNGFFSLRKEIQAYFGYEEDWEVLPLSDERDMYWMLVEDKAPFILYSSEPITAETIAEGDVVIGVVHDAHKTRRTAYRRDDFVAVPVDTRWDGNKYLMIFDVAKEVPPEDSDLVRRSIDLAMGW